MRKVRTAILISGRGSNMVSLAKAAEAPDYPASIELVISNRPGAQGIERARDLDITALSLDHAQYSSRRKFEKALHEALINAEIELICCAGFMRVLTPWFVSKWTDRLINIHPSLLPKYKGLNTHQRAIDAGDSQHGCTVHYISEELDSGAIIAQAKIDILHGDTEDSVAKRLLPIEHAIYSKALKTICSEILSQK